jgi:hypothetical protein
MSNEFIRATFCLLLTMQHDDLPEPMALTWSPEAARLDVQVTGHDFRAWLDSVTYAEVESIVHNGHVHASALGHLDPGRVAIRLVAITPSERSAEVAES